MESVGRYGTFYLAQGYNGAILGAMFFGKIESTPGWYPNSYGDW